MKLKFKIATKADLNYFDKIRGERLHKLHIKRINEQKEKKAEYIIFFLNEEPIGHIFIRLNNPSKEIEEKEIKRLAGFSFVRAILKFSGNLYPFSLIP